MPLFRRTKTVLLHMVYCSGYAGYGSLAVMDVSTVKAAVHLHSARILQHSAPQPLPTTYSRTNAVHRMQ